MFIGATFLIYAMVFLLPGDPIRALAGEKSMPDSVRIALTEKYNLDENIFVQYWEYLKGLVRFDFGITFRDRPVSDILKQRIPITARLAGVAFAFEVIVGILAGVVAGVRKQGFVDSLVLITTLLVISIPIFVLAFTAQVFVGVKLGWLPVAGTKQGWQSYIMPGFVLGSVSLAYVARLTRSSIVDNLGADYVRTATAKGLSRSRVVGVHTLRNSLIPVVTYLGIDLGALFGGAIVTESVFNIQGIGGALFDGIGRQEGTTVVGITTFIIIVYMLTTLLVDILYAVLDPRIRYE